MGLTRRQLALGLCYGMLIALVYSKFALTIGMLAVFLLAFLDWDTTQNIRLRFNPSIKKTFHNFWKHKDFLVVSLLFFIVLISGIYSSDADYWLERLRIKLPFLILPFAFLHLPSFRSREYYSLFFGFVVLMALSAIPVLWNFWQDYEAININLSKGQPVPTPVNHIRYSLMIAFAILSSIFLTWKGFRIKYTWERYVLIALGLFLFMVIHLLSVRSGLLVLYASMLVLALRYIYLSKKYLLGLGLILALAIMPIVAYQMVPSLQTKLSYMRHDIDQYLKGNSKNYSDAERLISIEAGLKIAKTSPLIGVGAGDLKQEVKQMYELEYPEMSNHKMPHNQLVTAFAGTGLIGLLATLCAFFFPLIYQRNYREPLLTALHVIVFASFFIENTLEAAVGVGFYSIFLMIGLNYKKEN